MAMWAALRQGSGKGGTRPEGCQAARARMQSMEYNHLNRNS